MKKGAVVVVALAAASGVYLMTSNNGGNVDVLRNWPGRATDVKPITVALYGATGSVGSSILEHLAKDDRVESILVVSRRPLEKEELALPSKATLVLQQHFDEESGYADAQVPVCDAVFWELGSPPSPFVSAEEYHRVHVDMPTSAARYFCSLNAETTFHYGSGFGVAADGAFAFQRDKVAAERSVASLLRSCAYRPMVVGPSRGGWRRAIAALMPRQTAVWGEDIGAAMVEAHYALVQGSIEPGSIIGMPELYKLAGKT